MNEKETVVTMVLDGPVGASEVKNWLGNQVKSITTEVRDAPPHWRLGQTESAGTAAWRYIEARTTDGQWTPIGIVRYLGGDRADVYAIFNRNQLHYPMFWINEFGTKIDGLCQTVYGSWKATIAS